MMVVMDGDATLVAFQAVGTLVSELWHRSTGAFHVVRAPVIDAVGNVCHWMGDTNPAKLLAFDHVGNLGKIFRSTKVPPSAATAPQYMSQPVLLRDRIVVGVGELVSFFP